MIYIERLQLHIMNILVFFLSLSFLICVSISHTEYYQLSPHHCQRECPAMFQYWCTVILITVTSHTATAQECTDTPTFAFTSTEHMYRGHVVVTDQVGSIIYYVSYVYTNHTFVLLRALIYRLILSG